MQSNSRSASETGNLGERIAERFLLGKGFEILSRNYRKMHGEIDLVAKDAETLVFVEVKTVTREMPIMSHVDMYRPEDRIDSHKMRTLERTAKIYLSERQLSESWRIDVVAVKLKKSDRIAEVVHYRNAYL